MKKDDFIRFIRENIGVCHLSYQKQQEIDDYLNGKIDDIQICGDEISSWYTVGFTECQNKIMQEIKTENKEVTKKAFKFIKEYKPKMFSIYYSNLNYRYKIYYDVELDRESVINDVINTVYDVLLIRRNCDYIEKKLNTFIENIENINNEQKSDLSYMFEYYSELIDEILFYNDSEECCIKSTQFILGAFCIEFYKNNPEKMNKYLQYTEKNVCGLLKNIYGEEELKRIYSLYFDTNEYIDYFKSIPKLNIELHESSLSRMLLFVSKSFRQYSNIINCAFKICMVKIDCNFYLKEYDEYSCKNIEKYYEEFNLPYEFFIELYLKNINRFEQEGDYLIERLESILNKDKSKFVECFNIFKEQKDIKYVVMLSLMLKNNTISKDKVQKELEFAEDILIDMLINMCKKNKARNTIIQTIKFIYNGDILHDFEILRKKQIDLDKIDIQIFDFHKPEVFEVFICMISLSCYSDTLKKLSLLFIDKCCYFVNFLEVFLKAEKIFSNVNIDNQYEEMYKYLGFSRVVRNYLNFLNRDLKERSYFKKFIKNHESEAYQELTRLKKDNVPIITDYIGILYDNDMQMDYKYVVPIIEHKLKKVVDYMEHFLSDKEKEARAYVELLLNSKNKNTKNSVMRLIRLWDYDKISQEISKIDDISLLTKYISQIYNTANDAYIPYLKDIDISNIRIRNSNDKANDIIIKFYLSEYMILNEIKIINYCSKIQEFLNKEDFQNILRNFYSTWLSNGADSKNKNILIPYSINCNDNDITELKQKIDTWTDNSRGELAAFAVTAMSINRSNLSLLIINNISTKYKNKRVKVAAIKALNKSAKLLNISIEELADKVIPDLGFNFKKEKIFDYGNRAFKAILNNNLEISLYNDKEELLKSLPKPNLSDNIEKVNIAKEELKLLKKQLKTIITMQKDRLEKAIITERKWKKDLWEEIFIKNPIMNTFAISLIWTERDKNNNIIGIFRYMEDGSFNSCNEEEYILQEDSYISLFHPLDTDSEALEKWKQQLNDYEIIQPLNQVDLKVYTLTENELKKDKIESFKGKKVYFSIIKSIMEKYNWRVMSTYDNGGYDGYYYEDEQLDIGIQLMFEYLYMGMSFDEEVKMCELAFYKKGTIDYAEYLHDNISSGTRILPQDVPIKVMNFALMVASLIAEKEV